MDKTYLGTTVNERLFISGLLDAFDAAVADKNYNTAKKILEEVELTNESIDPILDRLGLTPPNK